MFPQHKLAAALCLVLGSSIAFAQGATARTLVRTGHLLDVKTGKLLDAQTIVVSGDTISSVAPTSSVTAQPGDKVIDLGSMTVMPGLIDVHTHITGEPNFDPYFELTQTDAKEAIQGVANARTTLLAGFTTIRNVGAGGYTDVDLRDAINAGRGSWTSHAGERAGARHHRRPLR